MTLSQHRDERFAPKTMKSPSPHFADVKKVAAIVALVGLVLVSGFISSKTLLTETPIEDPHGPNVNAIPSVFTINVNSGESVVTANAGELGVDSPQPGIRSGNPDISVWVNTNTGVYHCPNTRWYGKTKSGKYMRQREAQAKGYRPAYGAACG